MASERQHLARVSNETMLGDHLPAGELLKLLDRDSLQVAHDLEHYEVARDVNSVRNNRPDLVDPLPS